MRYIYICVIYVWIDSLWLYRYVYYHTPDIYPYPIFIPSYPGYLFIPDIHPVIPRIFIHKPVAVFSDIDFDCDFVHDSRGAELVLEPSTSLFSSQVLPPVASNTPYEFVTTPSPKPFLPPEVGVLSGDIPATKPFLPPVASNTPYEFVTTPSPKPFLPPEVGVLSGDIPATKPFLPRENDYLNDNPALFVGLGKQPDDSYVNDRILKEQLVAQAEKYTPQAYINSTAIQEALEDATLARDNYINETVVIGGVPGYEGGFRGTTGGF